MEIDDDTREKIVEMIYAGRKIEAIKLYRELSRAGLKESKEFVEALSDRLRAENPDRVVPKGQGCGPAVLLLVGIGIVALWSFA